MLEAFRAPQRTPHSKLYTLNPQLSTKQSRSCEFCELKKLTLSALFYGKRGKLNHSVSSVFSLVVEREYKTIVVWLVPVDGVLG